MKRLHELSRVVRIGIFIAGLGLAGGPLFAQTETVPCAQLKTGQFYIYTGWSGESHIVSISRDSVVQKEIDGRDTTYFKTSWISDCLLKLVFIRSTRKMTKEEGDLYRQHSAFTQIVAVTPDYYLFKGSLDSVRPGQTSIDTVWRKPLK